MVVCSVLNCTSRYDVISSKTWGISFHRFPDEARFSKVYRAWIQATGRNIIGWAPKTNHFICSRHFEKHCFRPSELIRRLQSWAEPTLHVFGSNNSGASADTSPVPEEVKETPVETPVSPRWTAAAGAKVQMQADRSELDRFKRRLIRTVARLREQKCGDLWEAVAKAMGKDCRSMWLRMKLLTVKKMSRLLQCDDTPSRLSPVARMSITDWLLLDLVLVHEEIDTTDAEVGAEAPPLAALFALVKECDLENCPRARLAEQWARIALRYNQQSKQCSPMLLQRRWYDLKMVTRRRFYRYWDTHRRDPASQRPSALNVAIARKYPHVVTEVMKSWQELLSEDRIVLPPEFERIMQFNNQPRNSGDDTEDVVLIEPVIETIDVDLFSELEEAIDENNPYESAETDHHAEKSEEERGQTDTETTIDTRDILDGKPNTKKSLEKDIELKIENIDEMMSIKIEEIDIESHVQNERMSTIKEDAKILNHTDTGMSLDHSTIETGYAEEDSALDENHAIMTPIILKVESLVEDHTQIIPKSMHSDDSIDIDSPIPESTIDEDTNDILHKFPDNLELRCDVRPGPKCKKYLLSRPKRSPIEPTAPCLISPSKSRNRPGPKCKKDSSYIEIEIDFSQKLLDEDSMLPENASISANTVSHSKTTSPQLDLEKPSTSIQDSVGIDPRSLMSEVRSEIIEFDECDLEFADDENEEAVHIDEDILKTIQQQHNNTVLSDRHKDKYVPGDSPISVPSSPIALEQGDHSNDSTNSNDRTTPKFDLKLLMLPVVYTKKLDDMEMFKNKSVLTRTVLNEEVPFEQIELQSKPKSSKGAEINIHEGMDCSQAENNPDNSAEECLNDNDNYAEVSNSRDCEEDTPKKLQVIKETSYLFQKPKTRNYTPINLCKNPDFNTRLRRLSVAFLIKARNRQLIKACKPLTVDVQKSFEESLVEGMLLIKRSNKEEVDDHPINRVLINDIDCQSVTVAPSAMPVQSLFDKETVDMDSLLTKIGIDHEQNDDQILLKARQNKSIHLPDIEKVRQINRQLLTAQVSPVQVKNKMSKVERDGIMQKVLNEKLEKIKETRAYEIRRGPDGPRLYSMPSGIEYKGDDNVPLQQSKMPLNQELTASQSVKPAFCPKRKLESKAAEVPWYKRDYRRSQIKESYLLKADSLDRMFKILSPKKVSASKSPSTKSVKNSPVCVLRKRSYCCLAKRHKVLNDARCRLLINLKGEKRRRKFQKALSIHHCRPNMCNCCCKYLLLPSSDPQIEGEINIPPNPQTNISADIDCEITNALAALEPINSPNPVQVHQPAVGLAPLSYESSSCNNGASALGTNVVELGDSSDQETVHKTSSDKDDIGNNETSQKQKVKEISNEDADQQENKDCPYANQDGTELIDSIDLCDEKEENTLENMPSPPIVRRRGRPPKSAGKCKTSNKPKNSIPPNPHTKSGTQVPPKFCSPDKRESQHGADIDCEITNALAALEPINYPSPVQVHQPAVGLAPPVKNPQKQEQDKTPSKSSTLNEFLSVNIVKEISNEDADQQENKDYVYANQDGTELIDSIDLCDEEEENTVENMPLPPMVRRRGRPPKSAGKSKTSNKPKSSKQNLDSYEKWENEKNASKTAYGFNVVHPKRRKIVMPQLVPMQQNVIETPKTGTAAQKMVFENVPLQMAPGTKIMLLSNGQVFASNENGIPILLTESQTVALQMIVSEEMQTVILETNKDASTIPEIVMSDTQLAMKINDSNSMQTPNHLVIDMHHSVTNADNSPSLINVDKNDETINETIEVPNHSKNNCTVKITESAMERLTNNAITNETVVSQCSFADTVSVQEPDITFNKTHESCKIIESQPVTETVNIDTPEGSQSSMENPKYQQKKSEHVEQEAQSTSTKFLTVKNFAKMSLTTEADSLDSQTKEMSEPSTHKNSILSDLMEISGISSEDTKLPAPSTYLEPVAPLGIVQEWTSIGNDPNSLILKPVTVDNGSQVSQIGSNVQVYMYNPATDQLTPVETAQTCPEINKNVESIVEVEDSESDETPLRTANNQLMKLLKKKKKMYQNKKLKKVSVVKANSKNAINLPSILKKQSTLKKYQSADMVKYDGLNRVLAIHKKNRKGKLEAKIDLVDSDAPMEEEYLIDSQESEIEIEDPSSPQISRKRKAPIKRKQKIPVGPPITLDSNDSSDDEPLSIKVAKKHITYSVNIEKDKSPAPTEIAKNTNIIENVEDNERPSTTEDTALQECTNNETDIILKDNSENSINKSENTTSTQSTLIEGKEDRNSLPKSDNNISLNSQVAVNVDDVAKSNDDDSQGCCESAVIQETGDSDDCILGI